MSTNVKCQARVPSACVDPQCPERRSYTHQLQTATTYDQYASAARLRDADKARQFVNNSLPKPSPRTPQRSNNTQRPARKQETTRTGDRVVKFHTELGFPERFVPPTGSRDLVYSNHAREEAEADRYGKIPLLPKINLDKMELIELKMNADKGRVYRYLYRGQLDDDTDICLVLEPTDRGKMFVVTTWANERSDAHKSLDRSQYLIPKSKVA